MKFKNCKLLLSKIIIFIIIFSFSFNKLFAENIPIIVISPSKKTQSISTVGSTTAVFDESYIENNNDFFLGDVLGTNTTSYNFFQSGGHGTESAIQLRGLPKRYSTVYIDGVKMSDPSSVSNDYNFNHILANQISRVEILKGNQSSVYGSGAIGGTINITTKKGEPGFQKDVSYNTASHGTHNLAISLSGADENNDFYIGLERFQTDGISAMDDNDESDRYRNNTIVANYGHKFSDKIKFESNLRFADTFLQYDTADQTYNDNNQSDAIESSASIALVYKPIKKFTNRFTVASTYIDRIYDTYAHDQDFYTGDRKALTYIGIYNFNLDNSVVFGWENEFDSMYMKKISDERYGVNQGIVSTSNYIDFQSRVSKNLYATLGARFDEHTKAGNEDSHRATLAYLFDDKTTKLKSSYGTGFRFPSLYELYYVFGADETSLEKVKAETSKSFDIGVEKSFTNLGLNIDVSYFNLQYSDTMEGNWEAPWQTLNYPGTVKSEGLELTSKWKTNDLLNFGLNYTYTSTYDGAEQDNPSTTYKNAQMVRVPRHMVNLATKVKFPNYKDLNLTLNTRWSDTARDYGNGNNGNYNDEVLDDYVVNDLSLNYKLMNTYELYFDIKNIFDEKYNTALQYSQMERTFNFGIKRAY
jgi:vitamin B12 transporter